MLGMIRSYDRSNFFTIVKIIAPEASGRHGLARLIHHSLSRPSGIRALW
jgi:hypothetical protein